MQIILKLEILSQVAKAKGLPLCHLQSLFFFVCSTANAQILDLNEYTTKDFGATP